MSWTGANAWAASSDLDRGRVTLAVFVETYWQLHAVPNLAATTRDVYAHVWEKHLRRRVGDRQLRALTAGHVVRLRSDLEQAGVGAPTVRKVLAFLQGVLAFAIVEGHVDLNPVAVVSKPKDVRQRTPHVFMPPQVEEIRDRMELVDAALVSVLAYAGPAPRKRYAYNCVTSAPTRSASTVGKAGGRERFAPLLAPLASDLRELKLATGRRSPSSPVFAAHDGQHWQPDDYRNWRRRVWQGWVGGDTTSATCVHAGDRVCEKCGAVRCTPFGSRPRDLRGSYVTLRAYEGVPLTTIGKEVGCSVAMLNRHYAGVLANWDGKLTPRRRPNRGRARGESPPPGSPMIRPIFEWCGWLTFRTSRLLFAPPPLGVLGGRDRERFERGDELGVAGGRCRSGAGSARSVRRRAGARSCGPVVCGSSRCRGRAAWVARPCMRSGRGRSASGGLVMLPGRQCPSAAIWAISSRRCCSGSVGWVGIRVVPSSPTANIQ